MLPFRHFGWSIPLQNKSKNIWKNFQSQISWSFWHGNQANIHKKPAIAFISGHLDLTKEQFKEHYVPKLDKAITAGHDFVVGSARGADSMALDYLLDHCPDTKRITVYIHSRNKTLQQKLVNRITKLGIKSIRGFKSDTCRDAACTQASTYDIAWVRPKEDTAKLLGDKYDPNGLSGTEQNLMRRKAQEQQQQRDQDSFDTGLSAETLVCCCCCVSCRSYTQRFWPSTALFHSQALRT